MLIHLVQIYLLYHFYFYADSTIYILRNTTNNKMKMSSRLEKSFTYYRYNLRIRNN